jgi:hypothetical protein
VWTFLKYKKAHTSSDKYDYFHFFEQMGEPYFFIVEENGKIIACICDILRDLISLN